jgi:hypothetical protein
MEHIQTKGGIRPVTPDKLKTILAVGETVAVEFKRCSNGISADTRLLSDSDKSSLNETNA